MSRKSEKAQTHHLPFGKTEYIVNYYTISRDWLYSSRFYNIFIAHYKSDRFYFDISDTSNFFFFFFFSLNTIYWFSIFN